jgi:hypothetical protein
VHAGRSSQSSWKAGQSYTIAECSLGISVSLKTVTKKNQDKQDGRGSCGWDA